MHSSSDDMKPHRSHNRKQLHRLEVSTQVENCLIRTVSVVAVFVCAHRVLILMAVITRLVTLRRARRFRGRPPESGNVQSFPSLKINE
jgi:hypothetical protein